MKNFFRSILILSIAMFAFSSCDKNGDPIIPEPNPDNGNHAELWSYDIGFGNLDDITPAIDENDNIYFSMSNMETSTIVAFGLDKNGNELWKKNFLGTIKGRAIYVNNKVIISTGYPTAIHVLDATSGNTEWSKNFTEEYDFFDNPNIAVANNMIYIMANQMTSGFLLAYDLNGNEQWIKQAPIGFNLSTTGDALYFHDMDNLFRYNTGNTCDSIWSWEFPNKGSKRSFFAILDLPIGADGNIYIRDESGIFIVSPNGQTLREITLDPTFYQGFASNVTITPNNEVLIGKGNLVKFGNSGNMEWETSFNDGLIINPSFSSAVTISANGNLYDAQSFGLYCVKSSGSMDWKVNAENGGGTEYGNLHPPVLTHEGNIVSVSAEASIVRCFKGDGQGLATSGWPKPFGSYGNTSSN
jgi:outer membrane protein assembly factor BamB